MSLFMDHFRRLRILADPQRITNQFSWLLVLMIASIKAVNSDCWSLRTHFIAHKQEAVVACFPSAALSKHWQAAVRAIDLAEFSGPKPIVQSNTNCALKTHSCHSTLSALFFVMPRHKPDGKRRMAESNQHPNIKSRHDHGFNYMK